MFKNYIIVTLRSLWKNKSFSFINIFGLGVGITLCLTMLTYVVYENSYDNFQKNRKNIFRLAFEWGKGANQMLFAGAMPALAPALSSGFPEVVLAGRVRSGGEDEITLPNNQKVTEENFYFIDPSIIKIFTFEFDSGNEYSSLSEPFTIILSESKAKQYFGNENPIGKTLNLHDQLFKITGVYKDLPQNTHLRCEILASYSSLEAMGIKAKMPWNQWGEDLTYVLMRDNSSLEDFNKKLSELVKTNAGDFFAQNMRFIIQSLDDIHWTAASFGDPGPKGNKIYMYIFLSTAILVLIIACFNFMNLSTARYLDKFKEVGIRKVVGATRIQLVKQFLVESFIVTVASLVFGGLTFLLTYNKFYEYLGAAYKFNQSHVVSILLIIILLLFIIALIAGSYPAWFLSKFNPAQTVKNSFTVNRKFSFRQVSTIIQFAFSVFLIMGTLTVFKQIDFMKNSDIGINKENVILLFPHQNPKESKSNYEIFKSELQKNSNVLGVTGAYTLPGVNSRFNMSINKYGEDNSKVTQVQVIPADYDFVKTMELRIIEGRDFAKEMGTDTDESVILNETAVKTLNLKNPVGAKLILPGSKTVNIIGVVKDFHVYSFQKKINPCLIKINPDSYFVYAVRIRDGNVTQTISAIKNIWGSIFTGQIFDYKFMSDAYNLLYKSEDKIRNVLSVFTILAMMISCIGLIGFSSYVAVRKTKELGIRKVFGASIYNILVLFSTQFIVWIVTACIIAIPLAFYITNQWLTNFAYRISMDVSIIIISVGFTLMVVISAISFRAVRAAVTNPVESLRYE